MLDHVTIGVKDLARARRFYEAALAPLGYRCLKGDADGCGFGADAARFWVITAETPVTPDLRSGLHFGFAAQTRASVDAFHAAALAAGGSDNGRTGLRPEYGSGYYAAFAIDPDGYRIEACCSASS